jgi:hypothetical protein
VSFLRGVMYLLAIAAVFAVISVAGIQLMYLLIFRM